ncbi:MAG: SOS response-associated peptidase [Pseudomonadota bacterium]
MCGRFNVTSDPLTQLLQELVGLSHLGPDRFNVAPTTDVPVLRQSLDGGYELTPMKWWLTPFWAKSAATKYSTFNAKVETAGKSPSFREPFKKRRCVVPITGFYEWAKGQLDGQPAKLPYYIKAQDHAGLLLAGLWDRWRDPETGSELESFTILTTEANEALRFVHARQPVMLSIEAARQWLDPGNATDAFADRFLSLLPMALEAIPVSTYVNNARNEGPRCITPIGDAVLIGERPS